MKDRVLVLSPNAWDAAELSRTKYAAEYEFVPFKTGFYERHLLLAAFTFDVVDSIRRAIDVGRREEVRGVIGTHDYPASLQAAAVAAGLGLPGPPVDAALRCHHKYLCRQAQRRAVPDAVPPFGLIDPFAWSPGTLPLPFPFFVKPVKGTLSMRAGLVQNAAALQDLLAFTSIEKRVALAAMRPFDQMLSAYSDFDTHGRFFIAEGVVPGDRQVTVEGFVEQGRVEVMGIVDSVMYPGTISFQRFEYPSRLPDAVQSRMRAVVSRVVEATGFGHGCFNVELMFDPARGTISVIEMNPRMCTQFSDLYEKVDGTNGYEVQLALATGRRVVFHKGRGRFPVAGSFVTRVFEDMKVVRLPPAAAVAELERRYPEIVVKFLCQEGQWLSHEPQDRDSYRYGVINIGAQSFEALDAAFEDAQRVLRVEFTPRRSRLDLLPRFRS